MAAPKRKHSNLAPFAVGLAVGAGLFSVRNYLGRQRPNVLPDQKRINHALDRALRQARKNRTIQLAANHRYIFFSDHHKGSGDAADDFRNCKETYLAALDDYNQRGFTLVILGDGEELWEDTIVRVLATYPDVFAAEQRFYPERYLRLIGNHDNAWESEANIRIYLDDYFPGIQVYKSLVMNYQDGPETSGEIFFAHGHQGTVDADVFGFIPPLVLPFYRQVQNITGLGHTNPSRDECLRGDHDTMMYRWASRQGKLLFIAGHTHRPVWSSRTHLEKLLWQYTSLLQISLDQRPADYEQQLAWLKAAINEREAKNPPCNDTIKTRPCYFNTGCCRYEDGDITGIELEDGELRLIKWGKLSGEIERTELEKTRLSEIFAIL